MTGLLGQLRSRVRSGLRCRARDRAPQRTGLIRVRSDRGAVPIEFALGVGLLVLPIAALVLVFPTWSERQSMARLAAQEAARTAVLATSYQQGIAAGSAVADQIAVNHALSPGDMTLTWSGALEWNDRITAAVTVTIPALDLPGIGPVGAWTWTTAHTEAVDNYRSFP